MKKLKGYVAAGFGLLLLGAGCSAPAGAPVEPSTDAEPMEAAVVEPRMIDFHNNHIPTYDFTYDDNAYTIATGEAAELKEAQYDYLNVNDAIVNLVPEGLPEKQATSSLTMRYFTMDSPSYLDVEGALPGEIEAFEDAEISGFDARQYTMTDGVGHTVWLTQTGYYLLSVFDAEVQSVADSLTF